MAIDITQFNKLLPEAKIKAIKSKAPHIIDLFKKNISQLSAPDLSKLFNVANIEAAAKVETEKFTNFVKKHLEDFSSNIELPIKESELTKKEQAILKNTFTKPLIFALSRAAEEIDSSIKEGKGFLYTTILSEKTITVLEGIINFKKSIDQVFPGISDKFISLALGALLGACSPPLAFILKSSGILDKAADLLSTENLEKTVGKMYVSLDKIKADKELKEMHKVGEIKVEMAKVIGADPIIMEKLHLKLEDATIVMSEISKKPLSKEYLKNVIDYSEKHIPSSNQDLENKMQKLRETTINALEANNISPELQVKVIEIVDKNIDKAKEEMKLCLKNDVKIIDKVGSVMKAASKFDKLDGQINALGKDLNKENFKSLQECTKALKDEVNITLRGDVSKLIVKGNISKELAKVVGAGLANEVLINNNKQASMQISK